ncbi:hypothetical protein PHJA_002199600 [Phtheirospermum japonicum]|uniref:Uncharacterized protein n=1 Tax=Phtheirospermum japonicum TaxID=374723 RepID=A0A830CMI9_9LAMI|nr:hypothetical protein PHJA_002199600 [Phtheirospermum japonicum]
MHVCFLMYLTNIINKSDFWSLSFHCLIIFINCIYNHLNTEMAGQASRPPWFRMYFPSAPVLVPAPPPPPPPARPPPPTPAIAHPSIPIRQDMKESVPPPPAPVAPPSSAPSAQPNSPVAPPASPPRSPVATFTTSTSAPALLSPKTTTTTQVAVSETRQSAPPQSPQTKQPLSNPLTLPPPAQIKTGGDPKSMNEEMNVPVAASEIRQSAPPQSPQTKRPLSNSLTLPPPAQIKTGGESKSMNEQRNIDDKLMMNSPVAHNHGIVSGGMRDLTTKHKGDMRKSLSKTEDDWMGVIITLVGENKGAVMELIPSNNKNHSVGNPQSKESGEEISESRNKDEKNRDIMMQSQGTAFLNSNVQGLNNSVLCDLTYRQNNPGVRLSLNREP